MGFLTEKVKEKPDPNSKTAIDFDSKVTAERDKQIKVSAPNLIIIYTVIIIISHHHHHHHHQGDRAELDGGDDHRQGRQLHQTPQRDQWLLHPVVTKGKGQHLA